MADETPEVIEQQMHDTRQSLAGKLGALETAARQTFANVSHEVQEVVGSVRDSVQEATGVVQSTVGGVRSLLGGGGDSGGGGAAGGSNPIQDGIHSLASTATGEIRDAMDISPQIRANPWGYVGGAVAAGFITGLLFGGSRSSGGSAPGYAAAGVAARPGVFDDLIRLVGSEVRKVGENAISQLSQSVNQSVKSAVPKLIDTTVSRVVDAAGQGAARPAASAPAADPNRPTGYGRL